MTSTIEEQEQQATPIINSIEQAGALFNATFCHSLAIQMGSITSEWGKTICLVYSYQEQFYHVIFKPNWSVEFGTTNEYIPNIDKEKPGQYIDMSVLEQATEVNSNIVIMMPDLLSTYITKAVDAMAYILAYDTQRRVNIHQITQEGGIPQVMLRRLRIGDIDYIK